MGRAREQDGGTLCLVALPIYVRGFIHDSNARSLTPTRRLKKTPPCERGFGMTVIMYWLTSSDNECLPLAPRLLLRDRYIHWRDCTKGLQVLVKVLGVSHHQDRQLFRMQILLCHAVHISGCYFFNAGAEHFQEILWVAVKLVAHFLRKHLLFRIKFKDERIQDGVFAFFQLRLRNAAFDHAINLFI